VNLFVLGNWGPPTFSQAAPLPITVFALLYETTLWFPGNITDPDSDNFTVSLINNQDWVKWVGLKPGYLEVNPGTEI